MTNTTNTAKITQAALVSSVFGSGVVKLPSAQVRKTDKAKKAFAAGVKATAEQMASTVTEALDYLDRKASSACQLALGIAVEKARTPVFARLSEADYIQYIAPFVGEQIDRLPLGKASKPLYKTWAKSQFLAASWGISSEINNFSEAAGDMKKKLVALGIVKESAAGAKKGPKTPVGGATTPNTPATTTDTPQSPVPEAATKGATTPAQGAVSGNKLSDKAYDAAVFAFITALGIKGKDAENVRAAFGPTSLETTLRLLASSVG